MARNRVKSMSLHEKDGLMDCLFSGQDKQLINLKFFRGSNDLIEEEHFREQVCAAEKRKQAGTVKRSDPPKCKKSPLDLRKLVAEA
jgi:hypothetical protein